MNDVALPPGYLGPTTEARFAEAFAHSAIVGSSTAARLIGVDVKTLPGLLIRTVPKGSHPGYTERDLRLWLLKDHAQECTTPAPKPKAKAAAGSNVRLVNFSERRRKR